MSHAVLLREFTVVAEGKPGIEPEVIGLLVAAKGSYLGDADPARWHVGDLDELLVGILPNAVAAPGAWLAAVVPTTRLFLCFLAERGLLHRDSSPLAALLAELDRVEDDVTRVLRDTPPAGIAAVFSALGFDPDDPSSADRAMRAFNALPHAERVALTDPLLTGAAGSWAGAPMVLRPMPPMWLPPAEELAVQVRAAPLVGQLRQLVEWISPQRPVTQRGVLPLGAAREVSARLGVPVPAGSRPRSARDLPLHRLWELATDTGLITVRDRSAGPGPAAPLLGDGPAAETVSWWTDLMDACIADGPDDAGGTVPGPASARWADDVLETVDEVLWESLAELYGSAPVPVAEVEAVVLDAVSEQHPGVGRGTRLAVQQRDRLVLRHWRAHLARLAGLGAVSLADGELALTSLGRAGVRSLLTDVGFEAPLIDDAAALEASGLLDALGQLGGLAAEELITAWLAVRTPDEAAAQLLDVAHSGSALNRYAALSVLGERLGGHLRGPGAQLAERWRDDPVVGPHVRLLLLDPLRQGCLSRADHQWMALEAVALAVESGDLDDDEEVAGKVWEMLDESGDLETAWRCPHPQIVEILEAVTSRHPAEPVRKAAKKSLFKIRQRLARV